LIYHECSDQASGGMYCYLFLPPPFYKQMLAGRISLQNHLSYAIRGEASKLACTGRVIKELPRLAQQQRELQFQLDPMRREFEHQPLRL
jgi:hypothetical protein